MADMDVRIVRLEPMRVASVRAVGEAPETDAWNRMRSWSEPRGMLHDLERHPVFGFNNPDPSHGRKEYGYEFWIRVDPDLDVSGEAEARDFAGGLYAVTSCRLKEEISSEFFKEHGVLESWSKLDGWVARSKYRRGGHQWLEKPHDPTAAADDLVLDLYYPIEE
jgi:DNA gyrase inhibitor GyrI